MSARVVCAGTFDHLHPGHLNFLEQASALGNELIVIVARDETVKRIKGIAPEDDENCRRMNVASTGIPARVVLGHLQNDLFSILDELLPEIVAIGYDQRVSEEEIKARFPSCSVVRLKPFHPERFKSSFYRSGKRTDP
jgi:FAD synthetase